MNIKNENDFILEEDHKMNIPDKKSGIHIRMLDDQDIQWENIHSNAKFSVYHSKIWKTIVQDCFGHTPFYMAAIDDEMLLDVVPIFLVKAPFLGRKLISTPFEGCSGGISCSLADVRKLYIEKILEKARQDHVKYVEIRSIEPISDLKDYGFIKKKPFIISEIPLRNAEENWKNLSANHRRNVRIACKKGVSTYRSTRWDDMDAFYKILLDHYRGIGVPFFGKKYFEQIWRHLIQNNAASLLMAEFEGKIIGGHLIFFSGDTIISKYSACIRNNELKKLNAPYALFWEGIQLGLELNYKKFNLGITGRFNNGLLDFKTRFGALNKETHFYYYPLSGKIPDYESYYNDFTLIKGVWKRMPLTLTSLIGNRVSAWFC